jgi:2-succinyl-6-hydroxy-2,4-cyclohexadiene-1-carboxylate synthase
MGGRIAMYFALKYPHHISKLILESASPGIENSDERESRRQNDLKISERLRTEPITDFLNDWYDQPLFSGIKNHTNDAALLERRKKNDPVLVAKALDSFSVGRQPYLMNQLAKLKIPVSLICGENDPKYCALMKQIKQQNPHFSLKIFKNNGHTIHFENPVLFANHLLQFLSL